MHGRNPFTVVAVLLRRLQTLFSRVKSPHAARTQYYCNTRACRNIIICTAPTHTHECARTHTHTNRNGVLLG